MKILFVGTGSMWNGFNSASYLIDEKILIDMPNGNLKNLYKFGIQPFSIDYVLITHFHGDHYFDMPFYLLGKSKFGKNQVNVYCDKSGKKKINTIFKYAFPNSYKDALNAVVLKYTFLDEFFIDDYRINRILVNHGRMRPSYGYIISKDNNLIGFTGDTSLCKNVEYMASVCNYLVCDCMKVEGTNKHMGIDNIKYLSEKYVDCKFIVSHLDFETRDLLVKNKLRNVIVPNDNDILEI